VIDQLLPVLLRQCGVTEQKPEIHRREWGLRAPRFNVVPEGYIYAPDIGDISRRLGELRAHRPSISYEFRKRLLVSLIFFATLVGCDTERLSQFSSFAAAGSQYVQNFHQLTAQAGSAMIASDSATLIVARTQAGAATFA
jgi:hypothetical protein